MTGELTVFDPENSGMQASFGANLLLFAKLSGTGRVWLHSLPFSLMARRICKEAKRQGFLDFAKEQTSFGSFNK